MSKKFFVILIGLAVLGFGSYTFWERKIQSSAEIKKIYTGTPVSESIVEVSKQAPSEENANFGHNLQLPSDGNELVRSFMTEEQLAHMQDYFEVVESEEFLIFLKTKPTLEERFNFLADRGIDVPRNVNTLLFRESFPIGAPADFEPEMRRELTRMLIERGVGPIETATLSILATAQTLTPEKIEYIDGLVNQYGVEETIRRLQASDPALAEAFRYGAQTGIEIQNAQDIIREFWSDERNFHWQMGYFKGKVIGEGGSYEWSQEILSQVTSPAAAEPALIKPAEQLSSIQSKRSDAPVDPAAITPHTYEQSAVPEVPRAADIEQDMQEGTSEDIANLEEMFTDSEIEFSKQFREENFETALREQFSPKRLENALQLLSRYGPKEGLLRLQKADPEVAQQFERLLNSGQGENK